MVQEASKVQPMQCALFMIQGRALCLRGGLVVGIKMAPDDKVGFLDKRCFCWLLSLCLQWERTVDIAYICVLEMSP